MRRKIWIGLLTFLLALPVVNGPAVPEAAAAAEYTDVYIPDGGGKIVNRGDMDSWNKTFNQDEANSFGIFRAGAPGTSITTQKRVKTVGTDFITFDKQFFGDHHFTGKIEVAKNPTLSRLAQGGQARFLLKTGHGDDTLSPTEIGVWVNNSRKYDYDLSYGSSSRSNSDWIVFGPTDVIEISFRNVTQLSTLNDIHLYFGDITPPAYTGNTFTHNGIVRYNNDPAVNKDELFLKEHGYMNLALNFSEPVFPSTAEDASDRVDGKFSFMRTELFSNPGGDGFDPSVYRLESSDPGFGSFELNGLKLNSHSRTVFNVRYTAAAGDSTGNIPLDPQRLKAPSEEDRPTLLERINAAGFIDGAGNPLATLDSIGTSPFADNADSAGTFRTIIDARPPTYSTSRNGVQPELLTGLVLNEGDSVTFSVYLGEKVVSAYSPPEDTRLKFSNGLTAGYVSGQNSDHWTFRLTVPAGKQAETLLLETAALEHASDPGDGKALWDYAQNRLIDPVSSIAWAGLSVDNTAPQVNFVYRDENSQNVPEGQYVGGGSITINAYDPDIGGAGSPGLFRPPGSGGTGLVYYWLSQSSSDPFAGQQDHFAAVKRYSLTQKQPSEELYPSGFEGVQLSAAQNGTTVELPAEAVNQNGVWYLHTWTADMSWDSARQRMQYDKGGSERAAYAAAHPEATTAELEMYYRSTILPNLSDYGNTAQWPLSDFKQPDSNWSYHVGVLKVDNDSPEVAAIAVADNNTDNVKVTLRASDPTSSIKNGQVRYQFVRAGEQPVESGWLEATLNGQGETDVYTLGNPAIARGGRYELYAKAEDIAGNMALSAPQEIDALVISTQFKSYPGAYAINDGPDFTVAGVPIDTIEYQFSESSERPAADSEWLAITDAPVQALLAGEAAQRYSIPADRTLNGTWYAHVRIKQQAIERYYHYYKEYKFDHLAPELTFGSQGYLYPLPEQTVQIAVHDTLVDFGGVPSGQIRYQWVKVEKDQTEQEPTADGGGWSVAPDDRIIRLAVDDKADNGNYRLHVHVRDSLGNNALYRTSGLFAAFYLSEEPPAGAASLIHTQSDGAGAGAYTAVLKLDVDVPSQEGYSYSVSANGGDNWSTWLPYTNYVGVPVDTDDTDELLQQVRVKFRGYYGNVSEIVSPVAQLQNAPAYALASLEQIVPVRGGDKVADGGQNEGQYIRFEMTDGKTVAPTEGNPELPETAEADKRFKIYRNGSYSFNVTDGGKSEVVFIVVSNFDDTPPIVNVKYSTIAKTNGKVTASLQSSEPVRITNLPTAYKTFAENGSFTFEYEDAVGFTGSVTAIVDNIDTTPPAADIVLHYNHPELKALIDYQGAPVVVDSSGDGYNADGQFTHYAMPTTDNVIASNLIVAQVRPKDGQAQDFQVAANSAGDNLSAVTATANGTVRFTLTDAAGNEAVIESPPLATLAGSVPEVAETALVRVDREGRALGDGDIVTIGGKPYSRGKVRVRFAMEPSSVPANTVKVGDKPVSAFHMDYAANGEQSIMLTDLLGNTRKVAFTIAGLDNEAPIIRVNKPSVAIMQNKENFDTAADLGGYELFDNLSAAGDIEVTIAELVLEGGQYVERPFDLSRTGKHTIRYTAKDQLGNEGYATQTVFVKASDGMFVTANGVPLSDSESETAIVQTAKVTFNVMNFRTVKTESGQKLENELGTYDIYYFQGLVREGQLKYIATRVTYDELVGSDFQVTLPKAGWYTIVVQNQERERVYSTLLVSRTQ